MQKKIVVILALKYDFVFSPPDFSCHASSRAGQNGIHCSYSNM